MRSRDAVTSAREGRLGDELVERVLVAVECVPRGRVVSYGDIAAVVGTGPRVVGRVMALYGSNVTWWRVTNVAGRLPDHVLHHAIPEWRSEGIELNQSGTGCRIAVHHADLAELAVAYERRLPPELTSTDAV